MIKCLRSPSGDNLAQEKQMIVYGHWGEPGDEPSMRLFIPDDPLQHSLVQKCS